MLYVLGHCQGHTQMPHLLWGSIWHVPLQIPNNITANSDVGTAYTNLIMYQNIDGRCNLPFWQKLAT